LDGFRISFGLALAARVGLPFLDPHLGQIRCAAASVERHRSRVNRLAKMRVEKWKTDSGSKRQAEGNAESIQRNLRSALLRLLRS